jgi:hypothetical protein
MNRPSLKLLQSNIFLFCIPQDDISRWWRDSREENGVRRGTDNAVNQMMTPGTSTMLRARRRDVNVKPNRRLDRKSSRGMLYENEELRLRTININAEVERGNYGVQVNKLTWPWFQASAAMLMRSALFRAITQHRVVVLYWHFAQRIGPIFKSQEVQEYL